MTASTELPPLSLKSRILSAKIIESPPTSFERFLTISIICSISWRETTSGNEIKISDLSTVSSNKSTIRPSEERSIHL